VLGLTWDDLDLDLGAAELTVGRQTPTGTRRAPASRHQDRSVRLDAPPAGHLRDGATDAPS
jgi:hypothetical protein